jgi:serine/threonine protein kinase
MAALVVSPCAYKTKTDDSHLGQGSFGTVYKMLDSETGDITVVKEIRSNEGKQFRDLIELDILFRLTSSSLVHGLNIYAPGECKGIASVSIELPLYYEIKESLDASRGDLTLRMAMFYKLALGVRCLHANGFLHLDIKPDNMLCNPDGDLVLTDFGLSAQVDDVSFGFTCNYPIGTRSFRPPEILTVARASNNKITRIRDEPTYKVNADKLKFVYTDKHDIWSMGISLLDMLKEPGAKSIPINGLSHNTLSDLYMSSFHPNRIESTLKPLIGAVTRSVSYRQNLLSLLTGMLTLDPQQRSTIDQVLDNDIFKQIPLPQRGKVQRIFRGLRSPVGVVKSRQFLVDYPDSCQLMPPVDPYLIRPLDISGKEGLRYIIELYKYKYQNYYVRDLFFTLDIYMRLISKTSFSNDISVVIVHLAFRITQKYYYSTSPVDTLQPGLLDAAELEAIKEFKGLIKQPTLYDIADSLGEIRAYFQLLIEQDMEAFDHYFSFDIEELKQLRLGDDDSSKIIRCKEFFSSF